MTIIYCCDANMAELQDKLNNNNNNDSDEMTKLKCLIRFFNNVFNLKFDYNDYDEQNSIKLSLCYGKKRYVDIYINSFVIDISIYNCTIDVNFLLFFNDWCKNNFEIYNEEDEMLYFNIKFHECNISDGIHIFYKQNCFLQLSIFNCIFTDSIYIFYDFKSHLKKKTGNRIALCRYGFENFSCEFLIEENIKFLHRSLVSSYYKYICIGKDIKWINRYREPKKVMLIIVLLCILEIAIMMCIFFLIYYEYEFWYKSQ